MRLVLTLTALLSLSAAAAEKTLYVTDELRLGLYDGEQTTGRPFQTLLSGTELEVLQRASKTARVRTEDGVEGWVKTAYLVSIEPAVRRVERLERERTTLRGQLDSFRADNAAKTARVKSMEADLAEAQQNITHLPEIELLNTKLRAALEATGDNVTVSWLIGAALAAFGAGCLVGYLWLARRVRRRFDGLKVY